MFGIAPELLNALNFGLAVVNFCVATVLVLRGAAVNRQIGAAETTSSDQYAYEKLLDSRAQAASAEEAERYYDRFWAGQVLQFEHWRWRLIPDLIYGDWLTKRREQYRENDSLAGISFQAAWAARHDTRYRHTAFGRFMQRVLSEGATESETGSQAMRRVMRAMRRARGSLF